MLFIPLQELLIVGTAVALIAAYHLLLVRKVRRRPLSTAIGITNHARLLWVRSVRTGRRDILAVQTLRNQLMSSTFLASTAILISLGSFSAAFRPGTFAEVSHTLNMFGTTAETLWLFKLMLLGSLFFFTFFNFSLSIRYTNHAGYMINNDDDGAEAEAGVTAVTSILNHGALHYTFGMRGFYLSVPLALWLFGPIWMLAGTVILLAVLFRLDREA